MTVTTADGTMAMTAAAVATVAATAAEEGFVRGGVGSKGWMCRVLKMVVARKLQKPFGDFTQQRGAMFLTL